VLNDSTKNKVRQLYQFLKEANQLRYRPIRQLEEQVKVIRLADMPEHPSMQLYRPVRTSNTNQDIPEVLIRIQRPQLTPCPKPPTSLVQWLAPRYDDPVNTPEVVQSLNVLSTERFDADEGRVAALRQYLADRSQGDGEAVIVEPPLSIASWLKEGWDNPAKLPQVHKTLSVTNTVRFEADQERVANFAAWLEQRSAWVGPEIAARSAMSFYEKFYDIYASLEKDGEGLELMLGDGRLLWSTISAMEETTVRINHPILLKRVEVRFDAEVPEFVICETEREPELYNSLFTDLKEVLPVSIRNRSSELEKAGYHPLGWQDTTAYLKAFIQTVSPIKGEFLEEPPSDGATSTPRMYRDTVLFLRKRSAGLGNFVNAIIEDIDNQSVFPPALAQITGTLDDWAPETISAGNSVGSATGYITGGAEDSFILDDEILLAKEANEEQLQIIRKLSKSGSVMVQGPPGTGKTHTIGNVISHLLAQGKSILVTAQTAKALRVVRDKVPEMLQPLAVSVLGSDQSARHQLETSIGSITERMTHDSAESLLAKSHQFEKQRKELLSKKRSLKQKLRQALENEYREIKVGDRVFGPAEAARYVRDNKASSSWIPSPVRLGADLSLSSQELARLYSLGTHFSALEEQDALKPLPDIATLPSERQFRVMVSEYRDLTTTDLTFGKERWNTPGKGSSETLAQLMLDLSIEFSDELRQQSWRPFAIVAGIHGGTAKEVWQKLIEQINAAAEAQGKYALMLHHKPKLTTGMPIVNQKKVVVEICEYVENGGKLGFFNLVTRGEWKQFIKATTVSAGEPTLPDHFVAIRALVELEHARESVQPLWDHLIGQHIQQPFASLGMMPEQSCRALIPEMQRCLEWYDRVWKPLDERLEAEGVKLNDMFGLIPRHASQITEYQVIETLASSLLPPLMTAEIGRRKLAECEAGIAEIERLALSLDPTENNTGCLGQIVNALRVRDTAAYDTALEYVRRLQTVKPLVVERSELLGRLTLVAPVWSQLIETWTPPHGTDQLPGDVSAAWVWRQLNDELAARDALNANEIQHEIDKVEATLREVTVWLIDAKAWGKQLERLKQNNAIRQCLVGWLDTAKALISTRQQDRRQILLAEARKLMARAASAVPVWIMPISLVAENFDPRTTRFDVVVIDEASQADLNALIPMYLGKQVIIVGDHEQVTPLGVGQEQALLDNLRKQILEDIPNSHLFDAKFSIYDIGRQSFGDGIRLVEHFRCVPEIIAFSNQLSYDGKIKPLRESNSTHLKPACVGVRVEGHRNGHENKAEARRIVDLIKAMIAHPAYADKSIGVIGMVGDKQTLAIQSLILKEIPGTEIERRRILAGSSSEFQGDERDVVLLSMLDSPEDEGPMRLSGEGAFESVKKRYNVAVSRARDQLFVVHSFDPDLHLKPGDMRLRLMQHIKDPLASLREFHREVGKTESPFERAVLKLLTDAGYRVQTQVEVGYYRIDIVVEGGGRRLAVECDGDRYHPFEKLAEDIERQTILERLGWQFARIRGSAFYRNADAAMQPVFDRLIELEIPKEAAMENDGTDDMSLIYELENLITGDLVNFGLNDGEASSTSESEVG
jgi:very-short-patch-repair endonuclease